MKMTSLANLPSLRSRLRGKVFQLLLETNFLYVSLLDSELGPGLFKQQDIWVPGCDECLSGRGCDVM